MPFITPANLPNTNPTQKSHRKIVMVLIALLFFIVCAVAITFFLIYFSNKTTNTSDNIMISATTTDQTRVYHNDKYGFTILYPYNFKVIDDTVYLKDGNIGTLFNGYNDAKMSNYEIEGPQVSFARTTLSDTQTRDRFDIIPKLYMSGYSSLKDHKQIMEASKWPGTIDYIIIAGNEYLKLISGETVVYELQVSKKLRVLFMPSDLSFGNSKEFEDIMTSFKWIRTDSI